MMNDHPIDKKMLPFDTEGAKKLNEARMLFLKKFLNDCKSYIKIDSALDCGCGIGYFSAFLSDLGYKVIAFDARKENIEEAKSKFFAKNIIFWEGNIEDFNFIKNLNKHDLILCFGLLYHLENPVLALRNLGEVFKSLMIIETMVYPYKDAALFYKEESVAADQSINYIALVPTSKLIIKILQNMNLGYVYEVKKGVVSHPDFNDTIFLKNARKIFVVSNTKLPFNYLELKESKPFDFTRNLDYYREPIKFFKKLKKFIKKCLRI